MKKILYAIISLFILFGTLSAQTQSAKVLQPKTFSGHVLIDVPQMTVSAADTAYTSWYPTGAVLHDDSLNFLTTYDADGDSANVTILLQSSNDKSYVWTAESITSSNTTLTPQKFADGTPASLLGAYIRYWVTSTAATGTSVTIDIESFFKTK